MMYSNRNSHIAFTFFALLAFSLCLCVSYAQVTITPGTWITLKEGGSLMIDTEFHIISVQDSSGYFVDQTNDGDVTITGDIQVERFLAPDEWHNVSSPVSGETSDCFAGTNLVFWYNETLIYNDWNFGWVWYTGATGGPLMVFRGYDVFYESDPVTIIYNASGSAALNTGQYTYPVTITDPAPNPTEIPSHLGWNLAGNPYPSPVDWLAASGWDKSDINDAKYIWDGNQDLYTIFIGGGSPIGANGGTRFIPSNQGFWVQAVVNGNIGIANSVRVGEITGTPDYYKLTPPDYPLLSLVARGNDKSDEIIIRFIEGTTSDFDLNYDASKLLSFAENVPQLSIRSGKQLLAVSTMPEIYDNLCIGLDFQCGIPGYYQVTVSERSNLGPEIELFLKDDLTNTISKMAPDQPYGFFHDPSNDKSRFKLYFNPSDEIKNNEKNSLYTVFSVKNNIHLIRNGAETGDGKLMIYTLTGQEIHAQTLGTGPSMEVNLHAPDGYYILYIITNQYTYSKKVLIIN